MPSNNFPYTFPFFFYTTTRRFIKAEVGQNRKILHSVRQNRVIVDTTSQNRTVLVSDDSGVYGEF